MAPVSLIIDNSTCQVAGLTPKDFASLRQVLSYAIDSQAAYFSSAHNTRRYLLGKRGEFPTGLLRQVKAHLQKQGVKYAIKDLRRVPSPSKRLFEMSLPHPLYPEQNDAISACKRYGRGTISAVTGFGKSVTMIGLVNAFQLKTLIVVPNLSLKQQLTESFLKAFGSLDNITIENIDSKKLKTATDYDVLIIDEAHHVAAKTYRTLNVKAWKKIYYRFFFTATAFRSRDEEQLLFESIAGDVIYRVDYQTAVAKGYICPIESYYYELPKTEPKGNEMSWPAMYSELVVNNEYRNKLIANLLRSLYDSKVSTLCLVKEIKHGKNLQDLVPLPFASGIGGNSDFYLNKFNSLEVPVLIGTTGVLGEGVDSRPCEYVIIAGLGKAKNAFIQNVGRGVRRHKDKQSCKVILFLDKSHKWTRQHFASQVKYLKEIYGVVPMKLELPEDMWKN